MNPDLSQLRDIHMPEPVSWWPPAPGWWLLLVALLSIIALLWGAYRYRQRNAWRRIALAELSRLHQQYQTQLFVPHLVVGQLSVLLRRVAISRFPREEAASLSGDQWLAFLDRSRRDGARFQSDLGRLLVVAPYAPQTAIAPEEMNSLFTLCKNWISALPARGHQ